MNALILLVLSTYHLPQVTYGGFLFTTPVYGTSTLVGTTIQTLQMRPELQTDTGMGVCGMDAHLHRSDNLCHRDGDDSALRVLPVPSPEVN